MQEKNKRLIENVISLGILQVVMYIFPLLTAPYITRVIGVEKFGLVAFATAFIQYFTLFIDFGFDASASWEVSNKRHNKKSLSHIYSTVMVSKFLLFTAATAVMLCLTFFVPKLREINVLIYMAYLTTIGNVLYPVWFFVGMERMKNITFLNLLSRSLFVFSIFIFIKKPDDYIFIPLLTSLGAIIAGLISLFIVIKRFKIRPFVPKFHSVINQLKYSTHFFITKLSVYGTSNTNTFCLGLFSSALSVGYYAAAFKIFWAVNCLLSFVENPLYPYMNKNKDLKLYKKIMLLVVPGIAIVAIILFVFSKQIITIYYGQAMLEAYKVLEIFCAVLFLQRVAGLISYPLLGAFGHVKEANNSSIMSSVFHFAGLFVLFLLNKFDMYSLAFMILLTTVADILLRIFYIHKFKIFGKKS